MRKKIIFLMTVVYLFASLIMAQNFEKQIGQRLTFLQQLFFENQNHQFDDYLLRQFELFLEQNPYCEQNDQIFWMYGNLLEDQQKTAHAIFQYLKIIVFFPKSNLAQEAKSRIQSLIDGEKLLCLVDCQDQLEKYINNSHFYDTQTDALFNIFNFIFSLDLRCFDAPMLAELSLFEQSCQNLDYPRDLLLYWKGLLQKRLKQFTFAYGNFRKLEQLYNQSPFVPAALFESSFIAYRQLKKIDQARDGFIRLINHFPEDSHSPLAQFFLAELFASIDSLNAAIDNYRLFLEAFPEHPLYREAFKRLTFLYLKAHRYEEAVTLIGLNLNQHANDSTITALVDSMAMVFEKEFKKYETAARCYVLLASQLPVQEKTPYYLYRAARIYLKKMNDWARAADICNRLKESFPESPYTEKCKLLLKQTVKK